MNTNLKTIWNKVVEVLYDQPEKKQAILNEIKSLEAELRQKLLVDLPLLIQAYESSLSVGEKDMAWEDIGKTVKEILGE